MEEKNLIGQRIKAARIKAGLSQDKLGELMGVAFQSVQQWEIGRTTPRPHRVKKLATILNTTPNWLQFGTGSQDRESIVNLEQFLNSEEFKSYSGSAFSKVILDAQRLGWLSVNKADVSIKTLADLFYLRLFEEYGLSDGITQSEQTGDDAINQ